jgi:hypothetical protein
MRSFVQSSATSLPLTGPSFEAPLATRYASLGNPLDNQPLLFGCQLLPPSQGTPLDPSPGPHSFFSVHNDSLLLSSQARDQVTQALQNGWADSTLKRYSGSIKQYVRFCDAERVPEHLRFPADEFVLCAFAASSFGKHAGGTPWGRLSALKAWHTTHNVRWNGSPRL